MQKKTLAGALAASLILSSLTLSSVSVGANEELTGEGYLYTTESGIKPNSDYSNTNLTTIVDYTVAGSDISSFSYYLECSDDVYFDSDAHVYFVVTVDGVATCYDVQGNDEFLWSSGLGFETEFELNDDISKGSTYMIQAYTYNSSDYDYVYYVEISYETAGLASGMCGDNLSWVMGEDGVLTITGSGDMYDFAFNCPPWYDYSEDITEVNLSNRITSIGNGAFSSCVNLTEIDIPEGVTSIGDYAFDYCTSLGSVDIPDSVTTMGMAVFNFCTSLKSIYIPASVTDMDVAVAQFCSSLESVKVDEDNEAYVSIDDVIYTKDMTTLMYCMTTKEGSIVVPDTVTTIEAYAFVECGGITSIEMPETVSEIGTLAFFNCTGLTEMNLPDALITLSYGLLYGCSGITSLVIPEGVTDIKYDAVGSCSSMTTLWMSTGVTKIEAAGFYGCSSLTDIYYSGTEDEWEEIYISWEDNGLFLDATIHYECILGDINRDGEANYLDAMTALRYDAELVTLTDEQLAIGDVNNDGEVNSLDAILILRYDAGLIESF